MRSGPSSPSPAAPSSDDTTKVPTDLVDGDSDLSRIRMIPPFQSVPTHRNEHLDDGNLATSEVSDTMRNKPSVGDESDLTASSERSEARSEAGSGKDTSSNKIFINGYFMYFDKISPNGTLIWRCEYKNTCKARLHTDISTGEKENIRKHNHNVASDEEIKLYGLDPLAIVQDEIYEIDTVPDAQELRNVRERSATRMVGAGTLEVQNTIETAEIPNTSAESSGAQDMAASDPSNVENVDYNAPAAPAPVGGGLLQVNPLPSASLIGARSNEPPTNRTNEVYYDIARRLIRSLIRQPRITDNPTTYLQFFVAMGHGLTKYHFTSITIAQRDENLLKQALEQFCGEECTGELMLFLSSKFRIIVNQILLSNWQNNQIFLLDISQPDPWYLAYMPP